MGMAICRLNLDMLAEMLLIRDHLDIVTIYPPSPESAAKRVIPFLMESQAIPPIGPGMSLPEIHLCYSMEPNNPTPKFTGYDYVGERAEPMMPPDEMGPGVPL